MAHIPFLKPDVVHLDTYIHYLKQIDNNHFYSNFGPLNTQFEQRVIKEVFDGEGHCSTVNNCTSGLILAINSVKRSNARYALMPSFTFAATPLSAIWAGLEPYFIDIDPLSWEMDQEKLSAAIKLLGDDVAVVVPYATFANNTPLEHYRKLVEDGIPVVVDAAPGFGANFEGKNFGKGFNGCVVYSYHATKAFGIGEGGLVYSNNKNIIKKIIKSSNFGFEQPGISNELGFNAKLPEIIAAIALATLDIYKQKYVNRENLYTQYKNAMNKSGLLNNGWALQKTRGEIPHQFFPLLAPKNIDVNKLLKQLKSMDIGCRSYFSPCCHQQKQFSNYKHDGLETTDDISKRVISLPLWEGMKAEDINYVIKSIVKACQ